MGLSGWGFLGAVAAAFVGLVAYTYWGIDTKTENQPGVGKYLLLESEADQPGQQSGGTATSTKNSSSGTEAPDLTSTASEGTPTIPTESGAGLAAPTEAPPLGDANASPKTSPRPLLDQLTDIPAPTDSCTSQIWCADPAPQMPDQKAPLLAEETSPLSPTQEKTKEKAKKKSLRRLHSHEERPR